MSGLRDFRKLLQMTPLEYAETQADYQHHVILANPKGSLYDRGFDPEASHREQALRQKEHRWQEILTQAQRSATSARFAHRLGGKPTLRALKTLRVQSDSQGSLLPWGGAHTVDFLISEVPVTVGRGGTIPLPSECAGMLFVWGNEDGLWCRIEGEYPFYVELNGRPLSGESILRHKDRLAVVVPEGRFELRVDWPEDTCGPQTATKATPIEPMPASLSDDPAFGVLADALMERGDPRGEFCALQLALQKTPTDVSLLEREQTLLSQVGPAFLGRLHGATSNLLPMQVRWRNGYIHTFAAFGPTDSLPELLSLESSRYLENCILCVDPPPFGGTTQPVDALAARQIRIEVRSLGAFVVVPRGKYGSLSLWGDSLTFGDDSRDMPPDFRFQGISATKLELVLGRGLRGLEGVEGLKEVALTIGRTPKENVWQQFLESLPAVERLMLRCHIRHAYRPLAEWAASSSHRSITLPYVMEPNVTPESTSSELAAALLRDAKWFVNAKLVLPHYSFTEAERRALATALPLVSFEEELPTSPGRVVELPAVDMSPRPHKGVRVYRQGPSGLEDVTHRVVERPELPRPIELPSDDEGVPTPKVPSS